MHIGIVRASNGREGYVQARLDPRASVQCFNSNKASNRGAELGSSAREFNGEQESKPL